jgi:hypothetical protein
MFAGMANADVGAILKTTFPLKGVICYSKADIQWETVGVDHTAQERAEMEAVFDEFEAPVPLIL